VFVRNRSRCPDGSGRGKLRSAAFVTKIGCVATKIGDSSADLVLLQSGGLPWCRQRADLLQDAELVEEPPELRDRATSDGQERRAIDGRVPAGGRCPHELTCVGSAERQPNVNRVALGDQLGDVVADSRPPVWR
jgi:hypothetical protein